MKLKLYSSYVLFTIIFYSYIYQSEADLMKGVLLGALIAKQKDINSNSDNKVLVIPVTGNQRRAESVRHYQQHVDHDDIKVTEPTNSDSSTLPPNFKEIRMNLNNKNKELLENMKNMMKNMMQQKDGQQERQQHPGYQNVGHQSGRMSQQKPVKQNKQLNNNQNEKQKQFKNSYEIQFRSESERTNRDGKQQGRGQQLMIMMPMVSMKTSNMDSLPESSMAEMNAPNMERPDYDDFEGQSHNENNQHFDDF